MPNIEVTVKNLNVEASTAFGALPLEIEIAPLNIYVAIEHSRIPNKNTQPTPIMYSNGPINTTVGASSIGTAKQVSNSFTMASDNVTLQSAIVGIWLLSANTPASVNWLIGTTPFGNDISSGTSSLTNTFFGLAFGIFSAYQSELAISGLLPTSGTYYFTLQNATSTPSGLVLWNVNNGPSTAFQNPGTPPFHSNAFQINGSF